jgi:hypothetical protein
VTGSRPAFRHERRHEQIERPEAARGQLRAERLDPDADGRRERSTGHAGSDLSGSRFRRSIFLIVGAVAEAVFEIDPVVLDGLALQLLDDARMDGRSRRRVEPEGCAQRGRVRRVLVERPQREAAQLAGEISLEPVCATVPCAPVDVDDS